MSGYLSNDGPDLHRMIDDLVKEHVHREPYILRGTLSGLGRVAHHQARVPALIDQLLEPAPGGSGELSGAEAQARPAVRVEAHDTIELIASEAGEWLDQLGGTIPADVINPGRKLSAARGSGAKRALVILRSTVAGLPGEDRCGSPYGHKVEVEVEPEPEVPDEPGFDSKDSLLGELEGVLTEDLDLPGFDSKDSLLGETEQPRRTRREWCCRTHHVEADVRSWWRQARIIAGWDSPSFRPFASCPSCGERRGLRVSLSSHSAVCVECRTVWGPELIGLLAEHIRREKGELDEGLDEDEGDEDGLGDDLGDTPEIA